MGSNFLINFSTGQIIIAAVIASIIVILFIVCYAYFASHYHIKKMVKEVSKKYDTLHEFLLNQLSDDLKRIKAIADINVEYEQVYNLHSDLFNNIMNNEDIKAHEQVDNINMLVSEKKFKMVKVDIDDAKDAIAKLEEKTRSLEKAIGDIISVDDENRRELIEYKRKYRELKNIQENRRSELKYIEDSINLVFDKIDNLFIEIENYLQAAKYSEAKDLLPEVEKVINALNKSFEVLPKLTTLSFVAIPNDIQELMNNYNQMIQEGFPLHHLKFQSSIDSLNIALDDIHKKLANFQTRNIEYELNQIRDAIISLSGELDAEKEAKDNFKANYENVYNFSYKLENRFLKLRRIIPEYKSTYFIDQEYLDKIELVQSEISELGTIKRNLDTYVHASSQQPYTTLEVKLNDLKVASENISDHLDKVQNYLDSLKTDSENAYQYICQTFLKLKNAEALLRKVNVRSVINRYRNSFQSCYDLMQSIGEILNKMPINVESVNELLEELKEQYERLISSLENIESDARQAEEAIVYANQYRNQFYDVRTSLSVAEKAFFEGDFIRTTDETVSLIKKIRPDINK